MTRLLRIVALTIVLVLLTTGCDIITPDPPTPQGLAWARERAESARNEELPDGVLRLIMGDRLNSSGRVVDAADSRFIFFYGDGAAAVLIAVDFQGDTHCHHLPDATIWGTIPRYSSARPWVEAADNAAVNAGLDSELIDVRRLTVSRDYTDNTPDVDNYALLQYYSEDDEGDQTRRAVIWLDADTSAVLYVEVYPPES